MSGSACLCMKLLVPSGDDGPESAWVTRRLHGHYGYTEWNGDRQPYTGFEYQDGQRVAMLVSAITKNLFV